MMQLSSEKGQLVHDLVADWLAAHRQVVEVHVEGVTAHDPEATAA